MNPAAGAQKAANTPISSTAMNDIANVKTAGEIALDFPWDITSPEGIIAFFSAKMEATNAELKKAMYSQSAHNAANSAMKQMKDLLARHEGDDNRIEPGMKDYDEFKRLAAEVEGSLGASADENALKASIDAALAPGGYQKDFALGKDDAALADFKKQHPDAKMIPNDAPDHVNVETWSVENADKAIDANVAKEIDGKLTAITDSYQNASQLAMITVQDLCNQISQITSLASNIVHTFNEAAMGPIQNIK